MNQNPSVEFDQVTKTLANVERVERQLVLEQLNAELDKVWENPLLVPLED
jgi:hypothetical protein